jgi:hypothetical protein
MGLPHTQYLWQAWADWGERAVKQHWQRQPLGYVRAERFSFVTAA